MVTHVCSNSLCSHTAPTTTKYHLCPLCNSKLKYKCSNCLFHFFSSNLKHLKNCKVKSINIIEKDQNIDEFFFGKKKISIKRRNEDKICVAYFSNFKFYYGKERKKFGRVKSNEAIVQVKRKEKVQYLQKINNIPSKKEVNYFDSICDRYLISLSPSF